MMSGDVRVDSEPSASRFTTPSVSAASYSVPASSTARSVEVWMVVLKGIAVGDWPASILKTVRSHDLTT
jgi:hypothetical protein